MRQLSEEFKAHLESGATTLCRCWRLNRADGSVLGFTDHDGELTFDGVTFIPQSGLTASEAVASLGLGVDTSEVEGALQSDMISEDELHAGDYDNATVTVFIVNWANVDQRLTLHVADIGEVTCEDGLFKAELRGLMHKLDLVQGRLFENGCDADLGDSRCRVDTTGAAFQTTGAVDVIHDVQTFTVSGLYTFDDGWFDRGILTWISGANAGRKIEIDAQYKTLGGRQLRIWLPMPKSVEVGDGFKAVVGCDKLFSTCRDKFSNTDNFRGFPHIPGTDFAYRFARANGRNTGDPIIR